MNGQQPAAGGDVLDQINLQHIRVTWEHIYEAGYVKDVDGYPDGAYFARHAAGGALLTSSTPAGLESAIRADWSRRSAR